MSAIPTILKGDDTDSIELTLATGHVYTGATLVIAYQGVTRQFTDLVAGGTVSFAFTHDETSTFDLGTKPMLMRLIGAFGSEETLENAEARIKVTDCLAEVNAGGSFIVKPAEAKVPVTDVGDVPIRYQIADLHKKINEIVHVLAQRSLLALAGVALLALPSFGALDVQTCVVSNLWSDANVVTNIAGEAGVSTNVVEDIIGWYDITNITPRIDGKINMPSNDVPDYLYAMKLGTNVVWDVARNMSFALTQYMIDESNKYHRVMLLKNIFGQYTPAVEQAETTNEIVSIEQEVAARKFADNVMHTQHTNDVARLEKTDEYLEQRIIGQSPIGRFVSTWDCSRGKPGTEPLTNYLHYVAADYYLVSGVSTNGENRIPHGTIYTNGSTSAEMALDEVNVNDIYRFTDDGHWVHVVMSGTMVRWEQLIGDPLGNSGYVNATTNIAFLTTTNTVTKQYIEDLGVKSCDTNSVNDLIHTYDTTNIVSRFDDTVKYVVQTNSDARKAQARTNINAISLPDVIDRPSGEMYNIWIPTKKLHDLQNEDTYKFKIFVEDGTSTFGRTISVYSKLALLGIDLDYAHIDTYQMEPDDTFREFVLPSQVGRSGNTIRMKWFRNTAFEPDVYDVLTIEGYGYQQIVIDIDEPKEEQGYVGYQTKTVKEIVLDVMDEVEARILADLTHGKTASVTSSTDTVSLGTPTQVKVAVDASGDLGLSPLFTTTNTTLKSTIKLTTSSKVDKPNDSVPVGNVAVKGVGTNSVEWVSAVEKAMNAQMLGSNTLAQVLHTASTNAYTMTTNYTDAATNATLTAAKSYTDTSTAEAVQGAKDYTDTATNTLAATVRSNYVKNKDGKVSGSFTVTPVGSNKEVVYIQDSVADNATLMATENADIAFMGGASTPATSRVSTLTPDGTKVITANLLTNIVPVVTNVYTKSEVDAMTNVLDTAITDSFIASTNYAAVAVSNETVRAHTVETNLLSEIVAETNRAQVAEGVLTDAIAAEVTRATGSEVSLRLAIEAEATTRDTADTALSNRVAALDVATNNLTAAINAVSSDLAIETTQRKAADTALTNLVINATNDTLTAAKGYADAQDVTVKNYAKGYTDTQVAAEAGLRTDADAVLNDAITAEATARATADTGIRDDLIAETNRAQTAEATLSTAITTETTRATGVEGGLQTAINNEVTRATGAEGDLSDAITAETTRATTAEGNLTTALANEVTRATIAEAANTNAIAAEVTRAMNAETLLIPLAQKAAPNGVATLDADTRVLASQIPLVARNFETYETYSGFPPISAANVNTIYVAKDTNEMYRFDTTIGYVKIGGGGTGVSDYELLLNKPKVNGVELIGDKSLDDLGAQEKLPTIILDYYLHANHITGELEWKGITGGDISNYNALAYKPIINGNVLTGGVDLASHQLGLQSNLVFTAADNGKVLGVVNTNLMWVTGGGGSGDYREKTDLSVYEVENFDISQIRTTLGDPSIQIILADEELIKEEIPGKTQRWDYYFFNSTNEIVGVTVNQFMTKAEALAATSIYVEDFEGHVYTMNRKTAETFKTNEKLVTTWDEGKIKGYAGLDDSARVKIAQLPEDVKNVYDYPTMADFPQWSGRRENRIYIARDTNKAYRFDNTTSQYVELAGSSVGGTWGSISGSITNQVDLYTILTNKRDLADRQWIHDTTTPWTSTSSDAALDAILNDRTKYPDGAWRYAGSQSWTCDYGTGPTDAYIMQINTGGDYNQTYIEFMFRKRATSDTVFGTATRSFTKGENFVIETELEKGLRGKRDIYDLYIPGKLINGCLPVSISGTEVDNADLTVEKSYGNYTVYAYRGKSNEKEVCQTDASGDLTTLGSDVLLGGYTPSIGDHVLQVDDFIVDGSYVNANLQTQLVHTAAENGKVLGVTNNTIAWVTQTGGGGSVTNAAYREKIDYAYYAEDYYDLEPLKTALGIDYAYLVLADEKFRKQSTSTHWRWYMYNADFEMIGRSQEYSSPENAHASIINIECALGWAFLYKKAIPGNGIKTNRRIITEYEAGIEGGYQTNLIVSASDNGKVLGIANNKLSWVEGGSGGPTDTLILNGDEDIITGPYVIPHGYGEEGQMLVSKGTNAPPEWSDQPIMVLNGTITNAIGPVVIPGGYGQKGQILIGNNNSSPTWLSSGTIGSILTSNGEGANPSWIAGATAGDILVCGGANASPSWKGLETASITRDSTSSGGLTVRKMGHFCTISVNQLASTSGGGGTAALVGTISGTNYLPVDDYFGVSITPINGGSSAYLLIRNESSTMKVYIKGHTSGTKYYGSGFYITK